MEKEQNVKAVKPSRVPRIFKSKVFAFGLLLIFFILASFMLVAMDDNNMIRPDWPIWQGIRDFLKIFGIGQINVTIWTWFCLAVIFIVLFFILWACFFTKPYIIKRDLRHEDKTGEHYTPSRKVWIGILFNVITAAILVGGILCFWFLMPAAWKDAFMRYKFTQDTVLNILMCMGILLATMLVFPLALLVLVIIFELIIKLVAVIIGGITRNVIASQSYQEAKAATELVSSNIRHSVSKGIRVSDKGPASRESSYAEYLFPALMVIDHKWDGILKEREEAAKKAEEEAKALTVKEGTAKSEAAESVIDEIENNKATTMNYEQFKLFAYEFQSFLCSKKYYFDINILRSFIAGFGAARLILLEGLSGTGKSTLPRMFLEYVGGKAYFFPVQATWRDRSDITGYYSDFTGEFKETELLKHLYEASYTPETMNLMVLDEMNISRVEYYFADFLSIFEYPSSDWLVPLMQIKLGTTVPKYIENGSVRIPENTWFVGTVNIDDSTFTITDKVYDRAIVIDFKELNIPFTTQYSSEPHNVSMFELNDMFELAKSKPENQLSDAQRRKFLELCDYCAETFDLRFGNRIMNQIDNFLPIFVALGGTKEAALDIMFARKILRKLDGKFESYIKDGLVKLSRYINQVYGKHAFKETEALIDKLRKKLS